jgi:signal transduction histidine kinase
MSRFAGARRGEVPAPFEAMRRADEALVLISEHRVLWSNEAAEGLFEAAPAALLGAQMKDILGVPPKVALEICRSVTERGYRSGTIDILAAGERRVPTFYRAISIGGDQLHLAILRPVAPGEALAVEEERPSRPRRQRSSSAEVAAAVSHEIRAPLASALLYMAILEREIDAGTGPGQARSALTIARQEISRVERLVARVTEMHRFGHPVMRPRRVDLGQVVVESVQRALAGNHSRLVHLEIDPGDLNGWWDDTAIEQIVHNLLSNALKFGEERPVDVTVVRSEGFVRLSVRDRGVGLSAEARAHVFDRRVRSPLARSPGLGLGLWFVRELAEAHGGKASVRSRLGDGATFTVTLRPLAP